MKKRLYVNPDSDSFKECLADDIYVDKSMMIAELNKLLGKNGRKYVCVSRPRRFGKSMAGAMIASYYSRGCDSRPLFDRLKISKDASYEGNLNKRNVIKIDVNAFFSTTKDKTRVVDRLTERVAEELSDEFPAVDIAGEEGLAAKLEKINMETGETFIIIMDEYDVMVREQVGKEAFGIYLDFLNSLFKNQGLKPAISLAYLTGILPIVRDRIQSKLNEFDEYSMVNARQLSPFVGFTEGEVRELCRKYGMDYGECRRWYNGYLMEGGTRVYSPKSVVQAMLDRRYGDYWTVTGSYEALKDYILMNFEGIRDDVVTMIGGGRVDVDVTLYFNTMTDFRGKDDVFTYLIHLGYLAYDVDGQQCFIPNAEVRSEWVKSIKYEADYRPIMEMIDDSKKLLQSTIDCDEAAVAAALDKAHMRTTNPLTYNDEKSFQSAIGLAYFYANTKYTVIKELPTGKGYADLALIPFLPDIPAMVVELKNGKSAGSAVRQIRDRKYDDRLEHYRGDLLFVGISYDPDTKVHECKIERLTV